MKAYLVRIFLCLLTCALVGGLAGARTIEFETTEVTAADVALSPDGQTLVFTMLGHLFRLPVEGGTAEQLTFGPYYDTDPVFSPDGRRVAFVSDRDGSAGNVFVLNLGNGQITQVTHEPWAGRPTWTPDGQAIVYLRFAPEIWRRWQSYAHWVLAPALVRRVALSGGEPETLSAPLRRFRSVFYLPDGRLAWTVVELETEATRIEVMSPQGTVSTVRTVGGDADRAVPSPAGDGLYLRRRYPRSFGVRVKVLSFVPLPDGAERQLLPVSGRRYPDPQFAVAADNRSLYLGENGRLWKIALPSGAREHTPFRARVRLEVRAPTPPPKWAPAPVGGSAPPRSVLWPRLSPDGRSLVFGAAGYLWQQALDGGEAPYRNGTGQAERLFAGSALEWAPAFSPDGRQLAFIHRQFGKVEVRVFDFASRQTRTLASGSADFDDPSWSSDGQRLVYLETPPWPHRVVAVNLRDGKKEKLADAGVVFRARAPRPHFSADGHSLYFTANGRLYRLPLKKKAKPEPITQLVRHLSDGLVSPDGQWLAFRRNTEIWVAPLGKEPVTEEDVRQLSREGGDNFAFTPDGSAVIYAAGNRIWRHPLAGGDREEIPIRLELHRPTPPPLLVRRVRVLDFARGVFSPETSLYIEQGRIRWRGSQRGRKLPRETVTLDGGGRFAIPGLFDMHMHAGFGQQAAFLAYGVTSVRNTGGWLAGLNALADRSEATSDPVPRYFYSGAIFHGAALKTFQIYNEDDARTYVRQWKERGAHFIKVYVSLPWPLQRAVAEEAGRQGLPVVGHSDHVERITKSVTLGYAVLEHTPFSRPYDDVLQMLVLAGTRWDPTLGLRGVTALLLRDEPERLADAKLRAFTPELYIRSTQTSLRKAVADQVLRGRRVEQLAGVRAAHRRGVILQAGTDSPMPAIFYGSSLHWELEHFAEAGLPPLEVLRLATQEAAAAVGADDDLGTIEPGKLADLVLLDANPLEDIKNTQTIWRVVKGGWLFDPEKLRPPESTSTTK